MNRHEFANLLSQTQSMMAPSRSATDTCHPQSSTVSGLPLSPRQQFQAHVRTLSDKSPSRSHNSPTTPRKSTQLQHVSSLRVQRSESPSPSPDGKYRPGLAWGFSDSALKTFNDAPQFINEERAVWGRPSPLRTTESVDRDSPQHSPVSQYPRHFGELRPFAPLSQQTDENERPKTSRGPRPGLSDSDQEGDLSPRPSKFAEGSMNHRSAGVSSTWNDHASIASISSAESDDDPTPRPSPQPSSLDINEFKPSSTTAPTFAQRLFKFGTKAKAKEALKQESANSEVEPQTAKKKGLRKSMSMWNLHSDRKKDPNTDDSSPRKNSAVPAQTNDVEILNDRKRRAEEAYAKQFGMKRRKSNVGLVAPSEHHSSDQLPLPTQAASNRARRRLSWSSSTMTATQLETSDNNNTIDNRKRPSRRELEKENQQLRALLRQQQQQEPTRPRSNAAQAQLSSATAHPKTPGNSSSADTPSPRKPSIKKPSREHSNDEAPPVPPLPTERAALQPLNNTKNVVQRKSSQDDVKSGDNTASGPLAPTNDQSRKGSAKYSRRASIVRGVEFPHSVSMILEQPDEEFDERHTKENVNPLKDIPKLNPTPAASNPKRIALNHDNVKTKLGKENSVGDKAAGVQRETWEWPDDVF